MEQNTITLQDISLVVNVIDACSTRGAFKGDELAVIGQLRDKFAEFIKVNSPPAEETEEVSDEVEA